jgi:type I restriction enzyme S subunit
MSEANQSVGLPESWAMCEIGQISPVVGGGTPPSKDPSNFTIEGGTPWITPADLSGYREMYIARGARNLTEKGYANSAAKLLPQGALLFSSRAPVGYVAIAANPVCTNQGFKSFVLPAGFDQRFGYFYLRHIKPLAEERATGTTFKELSGAAAAKLPFTIAPLAEQKRIADKLEAVLGRVDACRTRLDRVPDLLKRFRQSVLAAACSGRLTADWREENEDIESGAQLLEKTKADPKREKQKKRKAVELDEGDELPEIPETWVWTSFGNVCLKIFDGTHFSPKNLPSGDFKYITAKNVKTGRLDLTDISYVSKEDHASIYARCDVTKGDVLYIKDGATTGIAAVNPLREQFSLLSSVGVFRTNHQHVLPKFLECYLNSPTTKDRLLRNVSGVAITRLTLSKLVVASFCLPPFAEQREIVRRVEGLFALADQIQARFAQARAQMDKLTPSLLARAFRGELVPQDPNDEPASVLLQHLLTAKKIEAVLPKHETTPRKRIMKSLTQDSIKDAILSMKKNRFNFSELREAVQVDYETLTEAVLRLLAEEKPILKQVFNTKTEIMQFQRAKR